MKEKEQKLNFTKDASYRIGYWFSKFHNQNLLHFFFNFNEFTDHEKHSKECESEMQTDCRRKLLKDCAENNGVIVSVHFNEINSLAWIQDQGKYTYRLFQDFGGQVKLFKSIEKFIEENNIEEINLTEKEQLRHEHYGDSSKNNIFLALFDNDLKGMKDIIVDLVDHEMSKKGYMTEKTKLSRLYDKLI